jgi:hypothetical protein
LLRQTCFPVAYLRFLEAKEVAKDDTKEKKEQEQEGKKAEDWVAFEKKKTELCKELENDLKVFSK